LRLRPDDRLGCGVSPACECPGAFSSCTRAGSSFGSKEPLVAESCQSAGADAGCTGFRFGFHLSCYLCLHVLLDPVRFPLRLYSSIPEPVRNISG
jgi:hypothetical protein